MIVNNDYRLGHRGRVRDRFFREGLDPFAEYEILELLLFFAVPRRDTKGMAHALIDTFSNLHGVLTADEDKLCSVDGIGKHTAAFLHALLPFGEYITKTEAYPETYKDVEKLGKRCVRYFQENPDVSVVALLMSNRREVLRFLVLGRNGQTFEQCTSSVEKLAEEAYAVNAPIITFAYQKDGGIPYPTMVTMDRIPILRRDLAGMGVFINEVICVSDTQFNPVMNMMSGMLYQKSENDSMLDFSKELLFAQVDAWESFCRLKKFLSLIHAPDVAHKEARELLDRYPTIRIILSLPYKTLTEKDGVSADTALLLSLVGGVYARAKLAEAYVNKDIVYDNDTLGSLFVHLLGLRKEEVMALVLLDDEKKLKEIQLGAPGTVSSAPILYRSITQAALSTRARFVAIAHNHPLGESIPSDEDISRTGEMLMLFKGVSIDFLEHFVVTDREYFSIVRSHFPSQDIKETVLYKSDNKDFSGSIC